MFERTEGPRLFGLAPGVDFPAALVDGLLHRMNGQPPEAMARVQIFVNSTRMSRRIRQVLCSKGSLILPRIRLITEIAERQSHGLAPAAKPLENRLKLAQLVRELIRVQPNFNAEANAFDLANSLATLMEEVHSEGVSPDAILNLDMAQHSAHWDRAKSFIEIIKPFFEDPEAPDAAWLQRMAALRMLDDWKEAPPKDPIIIAGSTGSRATTNLIMQAVAHLPQGAIVLPGLDFDLPREIWDQMGQQDHPQYRFKHLCEVAGSHPDAIENWLEIPPPNAARNQLISLALRPAPVTDSWLVEGPNLKDLESATQDITLLEAPSPRIEAVTIALRMRKAVEDGQRTALITPDRMLTRQVAAALQRWGIEPDDSAGQPLIQSTPARLLRQTAELMHKPLTADLLLALLKHPLTCAFERNEHLRRSRDLELDVLRREHPFPTRRLLMAWAEKRKGDGSATSWVTWLFDLLGDLTQRNAAPLNELLDRHLNITQALAAGPDQVGSGTLWARKEGEATRAVIEKLKDAASAGGTYSPVEYGDLLAHLFSEEEVRDPLTPHPDVMIWGTLEARVQGADLVILSGLNDGIWPELGKPDPWLNRQMRKDAGLLLPERQIGLAAHDFQQAVGAKEVWLTRSARDAEAETVPSRWLNRLSNLLNGLGDDGRNAFDGMRQRGQDWLLKTELLETPDTPLTPAGRPAPMPPVKHRPKKLSVTRIETLIRDPYAIYARYILNIKKLGTLAASPDAPLRGQALHRVFHRFGEATKENLPEDAFDLLLRITDEVFDEDVPWPATRAMWLAKLIRIAPRFLTKEAKRRSLATPFAFEEDGNVELSSPQFLLHGRADRIDITPDGRIVIYDYKSGSLPSPKVQEQYNKQLSLLSALADKGGFSNLPSAVVHGSGYIGLGSQEEKAAEPIEPGVLEAVWEEFAELMQAYLDPGRGYASRRAIDRVEYEGDYDHLARFGEWDLTDEVTPVRVGQ